MAFENAIITKEDDEKYGLSEIFYKYNPRIKNLLINENGLLTKVEIVGCGVFITFLVMSLIMLLVQRLFGFYIIIMNY